MKNKILLGFCLVIALATSSYANEWPIRDNSDSTIAVGAFSEIYCAPTNINALPWSGYHPGDDISTASYDEGEVYPVRDGTFVAGGPGTDYTVIKVGANEFDLYGHIKAYPLQLNATVVAGKTPLGRLNAAASRPHIEFSITDQIWTFPGAHTIKNPQNGIVPFSDNTSPSINKIDFRRDESTNNSGGVIAGNMPTIFGRIDVLAKATDDNGAQDYYTRSRLCSINEINLEVHEGQTIGTRIGQGIQLTHSTFFEKSPVNFMPSVSADVIYEQGSDEHAPIYIVTNNTDPNGDKSGLSKDGYWNTRKKAGTGTAGYVYGTDDARLNLDAEFPDGYYTALIKAKDFKENASDDNDANSSKTVVVDNFAPFLMFDEADHP